MRVVLWHLSRPSARPGERYPTMTLNPLCLVCLRIHLTSMNSGDSKRAKLNSHSTYTTALGLRGIP